MVLIIFLTFVDISAYSESFFLEKKTLIKSGLANNRKSESKYGKAAAKRKRRDVLGRIGFFFSKELTESLSGCDCFFVVVMNFESDDNPRGKSNQ